MLEGASGAFTSPNFPNHYSNTMDCEWTIQAPPGHIINLKFLSFDVEGRSKIVWGLGPVFSKVPKCFRTWKATTKILNLSLQSCSFHTILIRTKLTSMQSLTPIQCFLFEIQVIKNGFTGLISYRVFRETGPSITRRGGGGGGVGEGERRECVTSHFV